MIELSNTTAQTLAPGQSITFDATKLHTGCSEFHRSNSGLVQLRCHGIYEISFGANITNVAAGPVTLGVQFDGETLPESTAISTPSTVGNVNSVSRSGILLDTRCGIPGAITLTNVGSADSLIVSPNAVLTIKRVA